jgi:hypothetical protein
LSFLQAAQLQSLRSSLAAGAASNLYGSSYTQVLLELMLLDAGLAIPCSSSSSSCMTASAAAGLSARSGTRQLLQDGIRGEQANEAAAAAAVTLSVLVSAAVNLPLVPG